MLSDRDYMRGPQPSRWLEVMWPDAVTLLVIINVAVFVLQVFGVGSSVIVMPDGTSERLPWGAFSLQALLQGRVWTLVTHMFVHGNLFHLVCNCLMLFFSGKGLQSLVGPRYFLYVYFIAGLGGALLEVLVGWMVGQPHAVIGASAAVIGVFVAMAVMLPQEVVTAMISLIIPVRVRMWTLALVVIGVSTVLGILETLRVIDTGIAHFAHLGGALTGMWFMRILGYGGTPVTYERLWHERQRREAGRPAVAATNVRRRRRVVDVNEPDSDTFVPSLTKKEFIEREIDPILDKIATQGLGSLTHEERELLERARQEIMERESKGKGKA
ncbi:rhomboid family intramembrane serine protease [Verrucomicrobium sp. BvORR106]|uniref:rhomboid family intramembrane serine protease n=1 Tax=Verrucomicrobium sp. BvORR106 TaxID=1403819 RepID=UPI00056EEE0C|nr:rhomboid family intramembrane serine protease [Verrucomicrobium sp. BvORR106]